MAVQKGVRQQCFCFALFCFFSLCSLVYIKKRDVLKRVQARVGSDYLRRQILKRHGWHLRFVAKYKGRLYQSNHKKKIEYEKSG